MLKRYINLLKEILFPIFCISCKKEGTRWCETCLKDLQFENVQRCPVCHNETYRGEPCRACVPFSNLDRVIALCSYEEQNHLGTLIKEFKYHGAYDPKVWEYIFQTWLEKNKTIFSNHSFSIIPVPLHPRRERERGFNQSYLLAEIILKIPRLLARRSHSGGGGGACLSDRQVGVGGLDNKNLQRTKYTTQQAKLSGEERRKNLHGAFAWKNSEPAPEHVLLIDDIFTTGSTKQECAKVLKEKGSKLVWGLVMARG